MEEQTGLCCQESTKKSRRTFPLTRASPPSLFTDPLFIRLVTLSMLTLLSTITVRKSSLSGLSSLGHYHFPYHHLLDFLWVCPATSEKPAICCTGSPGQPPIDLLAVLLHPILGPLLHEVLGPLSPLPSRSSRPSSTAHDFSSLFPPWAVHAPTASQSSAYHQPCAIAVHRAFVFLGRPRAFVLFGRLRIIRAMRLFGCPCAIRAMQKHTCISSHSQLIFHPG
ncbi:hypothetical protein Nepgr_027161 [Nepenthes gracilis]|uniref:Uncharacterized protein n=1 Tax=Nepenthes gracilis TaxID=150966 RepID=A0AAD3Y182_NEPGR|nr:hypothetical protein Nepgr_027161 [Nepenthes gracilis]